MRGWVVIIAATAPTAAADSVAGEVSAGETLATPTTPGSAWVGHRIAGGWDVDDDFEVRVDLGVTRLATTAVTSELSLTYAPSQQWLLAVTAGWVPTSTTTLQETLAIDGDAMARAALSATSTSASLAVTAGYDTREIGASLTLGVDHLQSQQTFASIVGADGAMLTADYLRAWCGTHACSAEIEAALHPLWSQLSQFSIDAKVTRTEGDVELGVEAAYYVYDQDPRAAGHFRFPGPSNGTGMPIEPLRYAVSPTLATRWGKLRGTVGVSYGDDVDDHGYRLDANVRFQYAIATGVKLYARLATSWLVNDANALTTSLGVALGGNFAW